MTFSNFFLKYKMGLKEIDKIPFKSLPTYRKIFFVLLISIGIVTFTFYGLNQSLFFFISLGVLLFAFLLFFIFESSKKNLKMNYDVLYFPYGEKRIKMLLGLLDEYGVDYNDIDAIDLLIEEATNLQNETDFTKPKVSLKVLAPVGAIVAYAAKKVADSVSIDKLIAMVFPCVLIILMLYLLLLVLQEPLRSIINSDYNKYSDLKYDLRQIKIFYSNKKRRVRIVLDIHAHALGQCCDEYFEEKTGYGIHGEEVMRPLAEARKRAFYFEYDESTTLAQLAETIQGKIQLNGLFFWVNLAFMYNGERLFFSSKSSMKFSYIYNKYFDNESVLDISLLISCDAGEVMSNYPLRFFVHSREAGKHFKPHVHVEDVGHKYEASIDIVNGKVVAGELPGKLKKQATKVILDNQVFFLDCWNKMTDGLFVDINRHMGFIEYWVSVYFEDKSEITEEKC